jgi:hypothetical protein
MTPLYTMTFACTQLNISVVNDASNTIRAINRNMENVCRAGKIKNAKQTYIRAFFTAK